MKKAIFTIVSENYISYARTLAKSFMEHNPEGNVFVLLVDKLNEQFDREKEPFILIEADSIGIPLFNQFAFKYSITELNTAVKPFFIEYLYKEYGLDKLIYFDPDICFFKPIDEIFSLLDKYNILLTPHITSPIPNDNLVPSEKSILVAGCFNLGFIGLGKYENVATFIEWWKERLYNDCLIIPDKGLFVDQKWIDLIPSFRDDIRILKNPEYNVAYWNLHERFITYENDIYYCNNIPLSFFHFSGINPIGDNISLHQNRFHLKEGEGLDYLFKFYRRKLIENEYLITSKYKYHYGFFDNNIPITEMIRKFYYNLSQEKKDMLDDNPYLTIENSFYQWLCTCIDKKEKITQLMYMIYETRVDLKLIFPKPLGENLKSFHAWVKNNARHEYNLSDELALGKKKTQAKSL